MLPLLAAALAVCGVAQSEELGPSFKYDLDALRKTDPRLVLFAEVVPIPLGLAEPRAVAVAGADRILVAGDRRLLIFKNDGTPVAAFELAEPARCLAAVADGTVYAGMRDHIEVLDAAGKRVAVWERLGEKAVLTSIAAGESEVVAADAGNRLVWRFDRSGKNLGKLDGRDKELDVKGFLIPSPHFDLAFDRDGALWVVDPGRHTLRKYAPDGRILTTWGKTAMSIEGFCGCCNPTDIAMDRSGNFYTSEKGLVRVKLYGPDGAFVGVVAGPERFAEDDTGLDLAVDSAGRLLVLDPKAGKLRVFVRKEARK